MTSINRWFRTFVLMGLVGAMVLGCESQVAFDEPDATVEDPNDPLEADGATGEVTEPLCDSDEACDDGDPCTDDTCGDEGCVNTPNTEPCEDGDPCTAGDVCAEGACTAGTDELVCDDENECTTDTCDSAVKEGCVFTPHVDPCDDGNPCTVGDVCSESACSPGPNALECDDENGCTTDTCDPTVADGCVFTANAEPCDDGDPCTVGDVCSESACNAGTDELVCDDENGCTTDTCDPSVIEGCVFTANTEPCDDGNPCTVGDVCSESACNAGTDELVCDDENGCTTDTCDSAVEDGCVHVANTEPCDDGNPCTVGDVCADSACTAGAGELVCDDENGCTTDTCDSTVEDGCVFTANTEPCDDGDPCTVGDVCADSACTAGAGELVCDDENGCTTDTCDPNAIEGCVYAANAEPCDDGDPCTVGDVCADNACTAGADGLVCDDENGCTTDTCESAEDGGCVFTANTEPCEDGDPCTVGDVCAETLCVAGADTNPCDDGNDCTTDKCDSDVIEGCVHTATLNGVACDDGAVCTAITECQEGVCVNIGDLDCDDQNDCTVDGCSEDEGGCYHLNGANGKDCDDQDACTVGTTCTDGLCIGGTGVTCDNDLFCDGLETCDAQEGCVNGAPPTLDDGVACTLDVCDEDDDVVTHTPSDGACDNGLFCDGVETCDAATDCKTGTPPVTDDGVGCTADHCDEENDVITHSPEDSACDNGLFCDGVETCDPLGDCQGGLPPVINDEVACTADSCDETADVVVNMAIHESCEDDGNPCTDAFCDGVVGCTFNILGGAICDDEDLCSVGDTCNDQGQCVGEPLCVDDDNNPCVAKECKTGGDEAWCEPSIKTGQACFTGDPCLTGGTCSAGGQCQGQPLCDDNNPCTQDACLNGICQIPTGISGVPCTLLDQCALSAMCSGGECVATTIKSCDDGDACTVDFCDTLLGCTTEPSGSDAPCSDGNPCTLGDQCGVNGCAGGSHIPFRLALEEENTWIVQAVEGWGNTTVLVMTPIEQEQGPGFKLFKLNPLGIITETLTYSVEETLALSGHQALSVNKMVRHPDGGVLINGSALSMPINGGGGGVATAQWRRMVLLLNEDLLVKWVWVSPEEGSSWPNNHDALLALPDGKILTAGQCYKPPTNQWNNGGSNWPCYDMIAEDGSELIGHGSLQEPLSYDPVTWDPTNYTSGGFYDAIHLPSNTLDGKGPGLLLVGNVHGQTSDDQWFTKGLAVRLTLMGADGSAGCDFGNCELMWYPDTGAYVSVFSHTTSTIFGETQDAKEAYIQGVVAQGSIPSNQGLFLAYGSTRQTDNSNSKMWVTHLNASGEIAWEETYGLGSLTMYGNDLALAPDGKSALIVGDVSQSTPEAWYSGELMMRVDLTTGEVLSQAFSGVEGNDRFHSIQPLSTGGYFMTGTLEKQITDPFTGQITNYVTRPILTRFGEEADSCGVVVADPILGSGN